MKRLALPLLVVLIGVALAWAMAQGVCSIPGVAGSVVCGHNVYLLFPIAAPLGLFLSWLVLSRFWKRLRSMKFTDSI
jgi:hypothetical protein